MTTKLPKRSGSVPPWQLFLGALLVLWLASSGARADLVEMQNGDHYVGKVLSLNASTLLLQSEVLGKVQLPRSQVARISFLPGAGTNPSGLPKPTSAAPTNSPARAGAVTRTNDNPEFSAMFRQLGLNTNLIQQVQRQFLSDAGPEAQDKFNELMSGLINGKLNMNDLRAQAKSAADQLRGYQRDLGEDAGWALDGYLKILDHFLKETAPPAKAAAKAPAPAPKTKPQAAEAEE